MRRSKFGVLKSDYPLSLKQWQNEIAYTNSITTGVVGGLFVAVAQEISPMISYGIWSSQQMNDTLCVALYYSLIAFFIHNIRYKECDDNIETYTVRIQNDDGFDCAYSITVDEIHHTKKEL